MRRLWLAQRYNPSRSALSQSRLMAVFIAMQAANCTFIGRNHAAVRLPIIPRRLHGFGRCAGRLPRRGARRVSGIR